MSENRRDFLKKVGGLTAAAVAAPALAARNPEADVEEAAGFAIAARAFSAAHKLAMELDGSFAGWVLSFDGGNPVGLVVSEKVGPDHVQKKHLAGVKYEDITVSCGTGMSKAFATWLGDTLRNRPTTRGGALVAADFQLRELARLEFDAALITELTMPALDAASKDAAKMTIKLTPEFTTHRSGSGKLVAGTTTLKVQDKWLVDGFRLALHGLDCTRVNKIEAVRVTQVMTAGSTDVPPAPDYLDVSDLALSTPEVDAQTFYDWLNDFVVRANDGPEKERGGTLEYLDPHGKVLFALTFHGLGIMRAAPDKWDTAAVDAIRRVKAEMYCDAVDLETAAWR